jgi:hypothetical protein
MLRQIHGRKYPEIINGFIAKVLFRKAAYQAPQIEDKAGRNI